jgi:energy-coupling factor transporter ATP-binding protein EcfA2
MEIELQNVFFQYPGSERSALQDVSFKVKPGQLCCIVGYNGAGKSTLLDLICRIVDPTSGSVLINGINATQYSPPEIYRRISCQYQTTLPCDVTLREFMHMGDVHNEDDEARIRECLAIAGIDGVISRFPKGLDARLGPYPANPTAQSTLREFAEEVQSGVKDPWEADYTTRTEAETREDEENADEVVGGAGAGGTGSLKGKDCAFSPGEWQKLCFVSYFWYSLSTWS